MSITVEPKAALSILGDTFEANPEYFFTLVKQVAQIGLLIALVTNSNTLTLMQLRNAAALSAVGFVGFTLVRSVVQAMREVSLTAEENTAFSATAPRKFERWHITNFLYNVGKTFVSTWDLYEFNALAGLGLASLAFPMGAWYVRTVAITMLAISSLDLFRGLIDREDPDENAAVLTAQLPTYQTSSDLRISQKTAKSEAEFRIAKAAFSIFASSMLFCNAFNLTAISPFVTLVPAIAANVSAIGSEFCKRYARPPLSRFDIQIGGTPREEVA